jgi:ribosomal protein S17
MTQQTAQTTDAQKVQKSHHQQKVETVVSNKMDKTIVVAVSVKNNS